MRRSPLALPILLAVATTSARADLVRADDPPLDVASLDGALVLSGAYEQSGSRGCSQSFASGSDRARLRLSVDARNAATLAIDVDSHETFGPSPGRYVEGDHDFVHTSEVAHADLVGTATRTGNALVVRFVRASRSSVRVEGYGSLPLPPPTTESIAAVLTCRLARVEVLPATRREMERATPVSLAECTFETAPAPMDRFETPTYDLARRGGVVVSVERGTWIPEPTRTVRRAP